MSKNSWRLLVIAIISISAGCDSFISVSGGVQDEKGKPIPNAEVLLEVDGGKRISDRCETTSFANGTFEAGFMVQSARKTATLSVSAPGYSTMVVECGNGATHNKIIELKRAKTGGKTNNGK